MRRRLSILLRLAFLLLWLTVLSLWISTLIRGRPHETTFSRGTGQSAAEYTLRLSSRQLELRRFQRQPPIVGPANGTPAARQWFAQFGRYQRTWLPGVFEYSHQPAGALVAGGNVAMAGRLADLAIASWLLLALFSLPALLVSIARFRRRHRDSRQRRGLCLTCGYDLRASQLRCPECGTPIPTQSPAQTPIAE